MLTRLGASHEYRELLQTPPLQVHGPDAAVWSRADEHADDPQRQLQGLSVWLGMHCRQAERRARSFQQQMGLALRVPDVQFQDVHHERTRPSDAAVPDHARHVQLAGGHLQHGRRRSE